MEDMTVLDTRDMEDAMTRAMEKEAMGIRAMDMRAMDTNLRGLYVLNVIMLWTWELRHVRVHYGCYLSSKTDTSSAADGAKSVETGMPQLSSALLNCHHGVSYTIFKSYIKTKEKCVFMTICRHGF